MIETPTLKQRWIRAIKASPYYILRGCSACGYALSWSYRGRQLGFDSGCDCSQGGGSGWQPRDESDLDFYLRPEAGHLPKIEAFIAANPPSVGQLLEEREEDFEKRAHEALIGDQRGTDLFRHLNIPDSRYLLDQVTAAIRTAFFDGKVTGEANGNATDKARLSRQQEALTNIATWYAGDLNLDKARNLQAVARGALNDVEQSG